MFSRLDMFFRTCSFPIPGWPEFWFSWAFQLKGLADAGFHVFAMDLRGEPLVEMVAI